MALKAAHNSVPSRFVTEASMSPRTAAIGLGAILVLAGIIGFVPNPITSGEGAIFAVNAAHNLVHIVSGLFLLAGAYAGLGGALVLRILGVVYVVVAILGFVSGDMILGLVSNNAGDSWLHVVLAIVLVAAGFGLSDGETSSSA
jgi:hypothetical protein